MKFIVEKADLVDALASLTKVADKRQIIPILGNVLIESDAAGVVKFRASNLDMESRRSIPCDLLNDPGSTTVPAHPLLDIARNAADGATLKFDLQDRLIVQTGRSRFQLSTLDAGAFPALMADDMPGAFKIGAETLRDMLARTGYASSTEHAYAHLQGVHVEAIEGELWAVATDRKVLAMVKTPTPSGAETLNLTIPTKMVDAVLAALAGVKDEIDVAFSDRKFSVTIGATTITSKILDGGYIKFPFATSHPIKVRAARDELIAMINRVRATTDKADGIKLSFTHDGITASTRNMEGEGLDEIGSEMDGDTGEVGFGAKYLLDVLANLNGDIVEFQFAENFQGAVVVQAPSDPMTLINMGTQRA